MSGLTSRKQRVPVEAAPVPNAALSGGRPLDSGTRVLMEPRFGHDFSRVRVHENAPASASAKALDAAAYAFGNDIVFQQGRYNPRTVGGVRLLAHELAHVVQQRGSAPVKTRSGAARDNAANVHDHAEHEARDAGDTVMQGGTAGILSRSPREVRRADDTWSKEHRGRKSFLDKPYSEFKEGLGEVKATTEGGLAQNLGRPIARQKGAGTPAVDITPDMLKEAYSGMAADAAKDPKKMEKLGRYAASLNTAFKIMKIDTVEAQAVFLAHAFVESDQFRLFTESQGAIDNGAQKWMDDPTQVKTDKDALGKIYPLGKDVNPGGKFEFIGRGPVQVTHRPEYVESIAMLEKTAEQYEKAAGGGDTETAARASLAREAAGKIKADPRQAANPRYAFLFSAAFMKKRGADVSAAGVKPKTPWTGADAAGGWVAGGKQAAGSPQAAALVVKRNAFDRIWAVLMREARKASPKPAAP